MEIIILCDPGPGDQPNPEADKTCRSERKPEMGAKMRESVGVSVYECVRVRVCVRVCVCVCERERTGARQAYSGVMQRERKDSRNGKRQHRDSIGMWRE